MKKNLINVLLVLMLLVGVGLMLYPTLANYWNERIYQHAIVKYEDIITNLGTDTVDELMQNALEYNQKLAKKGNFFGKLFEEDKEEYNKQLSLESDVDKTMMGYLEIPKYNISLPIHRGTSDAVLASGVGHIEGTSLPVGGISSHCVVSGHTGHTTAKLLTDLDKVKIGDVFFIKVLSEKHAYEVDQILVVLPDNMSDLQIIEGKDLCTLVTCTPYGVNSHRLLVRGHRIEEEKEQTVIKEYKDKSSNDLRIKLIVVAVEICVLLIILLISLILLRRKRRKTEKKD